MLILVFQCIKIKKALELQIANLLLLILQIYQLELHCANANKQTKSAF